MASKKKTPKKSSMGPNFPPGWGIPQNRPKTWGKKNSNPRAIRRDGKKNLNSDMPNI